MSTFEPWTKMEIAFALPILGKIENNVKAWLEEIRATGKIPKWYPMPQSVYEAHARTKKGPAVELGIFDEKGRIFMLKRPSRAEAPDEPFPDEWHMPGVMYLANETIQEGIDRLLATEIGQSLDIVDVELYDMINERRPALCLIKTARVASETMEVGENRRFFYPDALPELMVAHHRDILLPRLIEFWQSRK